ncbi:MAG: tRNA (adenosine(37)-N6)-threonylcarbamoyltransferase complex dimerization subunit type 1 TsaB [bacterium]
MLVLGIDTSFSSISLGLADGEGIRGELSLRGETNTSYLLFPAIDYFLRLNRLDFKEIEGLAVGLGPGSFTGLRIALTFCKTLAYFAEKPIKGVSTLFALANFLPNDKIRAVAVPAYGGEVYAGAYKDKLPIIPDTICSLGDFLARLENIGEDVYLALHPSLQPSTLLPKITFVGITFPPRGGIIAQLGRESLVEGEADDPLTLLPNYLRPSQAERRMYGKGS